jgi:lipid II:glycine glycyltransferase (peptidoglycan interpeptide bridge formation enzyme)
LTRGLEPDFEFHQAKLLMTECLRRDRGKIIGIRDQDGNLMSALVYVWDDHTAYYKLSTRDANDKNNGAISHLIWEAIKDVTNKGKTFDFDGVPNIGSAKFFSGFGGQIVPRYGAERSSYVYKIYHTLGRHVSGRQKALKFY